MGQAPIIGSSTGTMSTNIVFKHLWLKKSLNNLVSWTCQCLSLQQVELLSTLFRCSFFRFYVARPMLESRPFGSERANLTLSTLHLHPFSPDTLRSNQNQYHSKIQTGFLVFLLSSPRLGIPRRSSYSRIVVAPPIHKSFECVFVTYVLKLFLALLFCKVWFVCFFFYFSFLSSFLSESFPSFVSVPLGMYVN